MSGGLILIVALLFLFGLRQGKPQQARTSTTKTRKSRKALSRRGWWLRTAIVAGLPILSIEVSMQAADWTDLEMPRPASIRLADAPEPLSVLLRRQADRNEQLRALLERVEAKDLFTPADLEDLGLQEDDRLSSTVNFLQVFRVAETLTSEQPVAWRGWLSRLIYDEAEHITWQIETACGFDLTMPPAQRVCFSTLTFPVFGVLGAETCDLRPGGEFPDTFGCRLAVSWPHMIMSMRKDGIEVEFVPTSKPLVEGRTDFNFSQIVRHRMVRFTHDGAVDRRLGWQDLAGDDLMIRARLASPDKAPTTGFARLWSRRMVEDTRTRYIGDGDFVTFEAIETELRLPGSYLVAARFLGHTIAPDSLHNLAAAEIRSARAARILPRKPAASCSTPRAQAAANLQIPSVQFEDTTDLPSIHSRISTSLCRGIEVQDRMLGLIR